MLYDIFQIDWIFVDTIIIILLILLLICVKIFKSTQRWRSSFSNIALNTFFISDIPNLNTNENLLVKKVVLIKNTSLVDKCNKNPIILILRTHPRRRLSRILAEGIGSNGYNVILAKIKIKYYSKKKNSPEIIINELKSFLSIILDSYKEKGLIINQHYIILNNSRLLIPLKAILTDNKNSGLILINPKINSGILYNKITASSEKNTKMPIYAIFSKNNFFLFPNKNLKVLQSNNFSQKLDELKIITLEKAKKSFKYYETIILGIIIDIIENKLVKINN
ncbi:MAG: hypothetical protein ACFFCE_12780 [Promethearchaeota archaeon]